MDKGFTSSLWLWYPVQCTVTCSPGKRPLKWCILYVCFWLVSDKLSPFPIHRHHPYPLGCHLPNTPLTVCCINLQKNARLSCRNTCKLSMLAWRKLPSPTETTLASYSSYSSKGGVQARMSSAPVVGWTNTDIYGHTHIQQLWWLKSLCCQSSCVECLAIIAVAGHEL